MGACSLFWDSFLLYPHMAEKKIIFPVSFLIKALIPLMRARPSITFNAHFLLQSVQNILVVLWGNLCFLYHVLLPPEPSLPGMILKSMFLLTVCSRQSRFFFYPVFPNSSSLCLLLNSKVTSMFLGASYSHTPLPGTRISTCFLFLL